MRIALTVWLAAALLSTCPMVPLSGDRSIASTDPERRELLEDLKRAKELEDEERWEEARDVYLRLGRRFPRDRNVLNGLDRVHRFIEDDGRYLQFLREGFNRYPAHILIFQYYLTFAAQTGASEEVAEAVRRYMSSVRRDESTYRILHSLLLKVDLFDLAEEILIKGGEEIGDPFYFSRELSDVYFRSGDYERSLDEALNVLRRSPGKISFVNRRMEELMKRMTDEFMVDRVRDYAARSEDPLPFLALLSELYIRLEKLDKALETLTELSVLNVEAGVERLLKLTRTCESKRAYGIEIEVYSALKKLEPTGRIPFDLEMARLHRMIGRPKKAEGIYRDLLKDDLDAITRNRVHFALGEIALYDRRKPKDALRWYRHVLESAHDMTMMVEAELAVMQALILLGDIEAAAAEGDKVAALELPGNLREEAAFYVGVVKLLSSRIDEGREILKQLSKRNSHFKANDAMEILVWLDMDSSMDFAVTRGLIRFRIVSRIDDPDKSLKLIGSLVDHAEHSPLFTDILFYRALAYRNAGRFQEAVEMLGEISGTFPEHRLAPAAEMKMGEILAHDLGDDDQAKTHFERVLLNYSGSIVAPKARRALEELEREGQPVS